MAATAVRYKDQGDIDYRTFKDFSDRIEGLSDAEIEIETVNTFYPGSAFDSKLVLEFLTAIQTEAKVFPYKLDLNIKTADKFIDADTFAASDRRLELAQYLVKKRYPWQKIRYSIAVVNHVYTSFSIFANGIKEQYPWIYNPPLIPTQSGHINSLRTEYMKDFVLDYGPYIEIIYVICEGDLTKKESIEEWPLHKFLFIGEYMLRKKKIESI